MILTSFKATNAQGQELNLPLNDVSAGIVVKEIEGLDPVKANLASSTFANLDGEQKQSSRRVTRNIILHFELKPDYAHGSAKDIRDQLYKFFMPKSEITLSFHLFDKFQTDPTKQSLDVQIVGSIESFDAAIFTQQPTADISIICYNPDFITAGPYEFDFRGHTQDLTITPQILTYDGSVEAGCLLSFNFTRAMTRLSINQIVNGNFIAYMRLDYAFEVADLLQVSSEPGNKYVRVNGYPMYYIATTGVSLYSPWIKLQPGDNEIRILADGAAETFDIQYSNRYGGL